MATHLSNQELAGYISQPSSEDFSFVKSHINSCKTCRASYEQMQAIARQLKNSRTTEMPQVGEPHLADEEVIAYTHSQLTRDEQNSIQAHLDDCGSCMKAVLRYRAYLAEYEAQRHGDTSDDNVISLGRSPQNNRVITRFALPVAAAAIVILSVGIVLQWQIIKTPESITSAEQIARPDLITAETSGQASVRSVVLPVNSGASRAINWYGGYIETTAVGTADMKKMKNRVQAEIVAEKTARHLAYSQLAEILKGIQVTSNTTYEDLLLKVDTLNIQSEGFIQGAQVMNKTISWVDDAPKATVTVKAPLFGQNSLKNILQAEAEDILLKQPAQVMTSNSSIRTQATQYSNVIIDASGIDYSPALFTTLESSDKQSILSENNMMKLEYMYYSSLDTAKNSGFAGSAPIVFKAQRGSTPGTLMLDQTDARLAHTILQKQLSNTDKPVLVVF